MSTLNKLYCLKRLGESMLVGCGNTELRKSLKMKGMKEKCLHDPSGKGLKPAETQAAPGPAGGWRMEHVDLPYPWLLIGLGTSVQLFGQNPWLCIGCLAMEL